VATLGALELALDSLAALLGPDPATWTWGRAHRAVFKSGMAGRPGPWEPKPTPVDGDNSTPCVGQSSLPWSANVTHGPVFRHVVDLAVLDSSLAVLPPGNSGTAASGHQADLLGRWASHGYVPLYLSWERVEAMKESEITLEPPR
jgi:penicillin G amidase